MDDLDRYLSVGTGKCEADKSGDEHHETAEGGFSEGSVGFHFAD
jgi:hypothetical protein